MEQEHVRLDSAAAYHVVETFMALADLLDPAAASPEPLSEAQRRLLTDPIARIETRKPVEMAQRFRREAKMIFDQMSDPFAFRRWPQLNG